MQDFVIADEEAIAKGVRRIVAVTGSEAAKALARADVLDARFSGLQADLKASIAAGTGAARYTEFNRTITEFTDEISSALIPYKRRVQLRAGLATVKKTLDNVDKQRKAQMTTEVVAAAGALAERCQAGDVKYVVHRFDAASNAKALDSAMKVLKAA